jgi:hypothetical protein
MGWSIGYDKNWQRDIGYGVPAECDHPGCFEEIDRGLSYVCGGEPYGGAHGCGLYFCSKHLYMAGDAKNNAQLCLRCRYGKKAYHPKPDLKVWIEWKLNDESWQQWREQNPEAVEALKLDLASRKDWPVKLSKSEKGDPMNIQVFQINDCEFFVGQGTPQQMLDAYMEHTGFSREESIGPPGREVMPRPLTDEEMETMTFVDEDQSRRSFKAQLQLILDGMDPVIKPADMPCFFGSTEI